MCCNEKYLNELKAFNDLFDYLNETFFESALSKPVITIQANRKPNTLGWCTGYNAWQSGEEKSPEINLSADYLDRQPIDKVETLLHEMCHLYAFQNNIKDTSRSGNYHNKQYKEIAEKHGLKVEKSSKGGFDITTLTENAKQLIKPYVNNLQALKRISPLKIVTSKSSTRKYICRSCGLSVRATKEVNIICGDCNQRMELE
ncbi:MAG TPA: SprT-like domain-containing protein [Clostridia bacterium]